MQDIVLVFLGALALLFISRKVAKKVGLVDKPNARKHHNGHIPLVGGVSVYLSLWIIYILQPGWLPDFTLYMACATMLIVVGVLDDKLDLPVMPRMALQALVASIMMYNGLYLYSLGNILFGYELVLGVLGYGVTLLAVVGAINAFNMVDGIDGLLGALSSVTFGALATVFWMGGNDEMALWCLCLMVACLPYILLNLGIPWGRKFKVFMGDAGSTLIGFTVIWLLIVATQGDDAVMQPVTALWLIAVPLMDMLRVMIARIRRGDSPFKPDREHLHHVLLKYGMKPHLSVLCVTGGAVINSFIGIVFDFYRVSTTVNLFFYLANMFFYFVLIRSIAANNIKSVLENI
ncbi:UDP-N-acetylglucosamine--undecaprenyl-phosphate N-acetylglucosaminephosphotransferase [Mixta calida]|uniref:Undecaprenyl-phosphate alpha-N-acetylglucosaminyl 1-phosphate transferase n=1 Tax=Mixta calida TaxID=665913 RepID=A0ABN5HB53_9GAMM|nr:UDP-N-acetylglucosamine--undecaprenyl-phosphate N-acetylglucosaminephosphotransferase [Mixta calida]AUY25857.1 UDP-N-acetylglucosamine--undecaprenyl-phosphate N-acetylglucosaminephosphotransferase [Mixta calida]KAF0859835.1 UDP-phosphate alpha-N-acetylglucosaminyl 1-phosphate transferase [Mixta calida B021323]ORM56405.1 undecaprenyl-phosphate alpha-N-acetylglucosaminyl 1-phosphate transferase [Mixta calida]